MNKEVLHEDLETNDATRCKNCGAYLFEVGTEETKTDPHTHQEMTHIVCNKCGYIQAVTQTA